MNIFDKGDEIQPKTDFDKIGVNVVRPYKKDGRWVFDKDGNTFDMAPAGLTDFALSPMILGGDRLILAATSIKNISDPEGGFHLLFSETYFPGCDAKFTFKENRFDGWVYDVTAENLQGVITGQQAWVCPYLSLYYDKPPQTIYLKMEGRDG